MTSTGACSLRKWGPSARGKSSPRRLHNSLIYPNMSIIGLNIHVRVIKPIAVDRTEVNIYPIEASWERRRP